MTPDPLDALRLPDDPVAPRPEFAARLRRQIEVALDLAEPHQRSTAMTTPSTSNAAPYCVPASFWFASDLQPYLSVADAAAAIDFYVAVFGAVEVMRLTQPDGRIGHAELRIGSSGIMLADEFPDMGFVGPLVRGGTSVSLHLSVPDVDATVAAAVDAGATLERAVVDEFYGQRSGTILDPFGHRWMIQTPIEEVSAEEMQRRLSELSDDD